MSQTIITQISDLSDPKYIGQKITVLGYAQTVRRQTKKLCFVELKYGSDLIQVVIDDPKLTTGLTVQSYLKVVGTVVTTLKRSPPVEIQCTDFTILSRADPSYASECPSDAGPDIKLEKRHLYLRDPHFALITTVRAQLIEAIRKYFKKSKCLEIIPPSFTGVQCEGGASLFHVEHPSKSTDKPMTAYLTQSSQFALEMALPGVGDCYCIAPSFRAEHSHTRRHLTEFLHAEAEWGGILTFDDHIKKLRDLLQGIVTFFLKIAKDTLKELEVYDRVVGLLELTKDIMILTHKDAIVQLKEHEIYKDEETKTLFDERDDIPEAQERELIDKIGKIVFLVKFPEEFKSFYMALDPDDPTRVLGCDVEVPGVGEIIGSGVREGHYERLHARLLKSGLKPDDYKEYLDLRKFGFGFTSGMGLGVDRMLTWLLGVHSIREVVTFPRFPGYLRP